MKLLLTIVTLSLAVPAASGKEFPPGDLRICGATQCRVVTDAQSQAFSDLLWGNQLVVRAAIPSVGSPIYQLRFQRGPLGAIVSPTAIRVHGLNCGRFQRGRWFRLPRALQGLTTGLRPKRLRAHVPPSC